MTMLSLGISVLQRTLSRQSQFIRVPQITLPLIFLALVVLGTGKLTGDLDCGCWAVKSMAAGNMFSPSARL